MIRGGLKISLVPKNGWNCNIYLITESEVVTGKSQTEALPY